MTRCGMMLSMSWTGRGFKHPIRYAFPWNMRLLGDQLSASFFNPFAREETASQDNFMTDIDSKVLLACSRFLFLSQVSCRRYKTFATPQGSS